MNEAQIITAVADKLLGIDLTSYELKVLRVSTAMIPEHTADALGHAKFGPLHEELSYEMFTIGWMIWAQQLTPIVGHPELKMLLDFARARGYYFVRLEADAEPLPQQCGLPVFSW